MFVCFLLSQKFISYALFNTFMFFWHFISVTLHAWNHTRTIFPFSIVFHRIKSFHFYVKGKISRSIIKFMLLSSSRRVRKRNEGCHKSVLKEERKKFSFLAKSSFYVCTHKKAAGASNSICDSLYISIYDVFIKFILPHTQGMQA